MIKKLMRGYALALVLFSACGPSADQKAAVGLHVTLEAARVSFDAWDLAHQRALAAAQPTPELKHAAVDAYRLKRSSVIDALIATYSAVDAAVIRPSGQTVGTALDAVKKLATAIGALETSEKGPTP